MINSITKFAALWAMATVGVVLLSLGNIWAAGVGCLLFAASSFYSVHRWQLKSVANLIYNSVCAIVLFLVWYIFKPSISVLTVAWLAYTISEINQRRRLSTQQRGPTAI